MAIPDHPWTKATRDAAAVRIAMTVAAAGKHQGLLREVAVESALDSDQPQIVFQDAAGSINGDLTVGVDVMKALGLRANQGLSSRGMSLHGAGFIVSPAEARHLGLGARPGLERHIRAYRNGRDLTSRPRGVMVIDLFGLQAEDVRQRFPELYQHISLTVKPERDRNNRETYRDNWWIFGEPRRELRPALTDLPRYIATVETAKHRVFQFLDADILPDNRLVLVAAKDSYVLGVLSSRFHVTWALRTGGTLEDRPIYTKSRCFDPFPFPDATAQQSLQIGMIAEELDAHRNDRLSQHPHLTLTGLYNVLEMLRAGAAPESLTPDDRQIFDDGLVLILKELHDRLDAAVAEAYGWPADLGEEATLERLVALNAARRAEEARGKVRWLRPEYQISRFAKPGEKAQQIEADLVAAEATLPRASFPADEMAQTAAIMAALAAAEGPLAPADLAGAFRQGRRVQPKVGQVLGALVRMGFVTRTGPAQADGYALRRQ